MSKAIIDPEPRVNGTSRVSQTFSFNEQDYINRLLDVLTEIHGSYTLHDEMLVRKLVECERDFARCSDVLRQTEMSMFQVSAANGLLPSAWFNARERLLSSILKIRKDLGIDLMSRKNSVKGANTSDERFEEYYKPKEKAFAI